MTKSRMWINKSSKNLITSKRNFLLMRIKLIINQVIYIMIMINLNKKMIIIISNYNLISRQLMQMIINHLKIQIVKVTIKNHYILIISRDLKTSKKKNLTSNKDIIALNAIQMCPHCIYTKLIIINVEHKINCKIILKNT